MKVPLFIRLLLYIFSRFGRLVLWEIIFILELQFAETQDWDGRKISEMFLGNCKFACNFRKAVLY